MKEPKILVIAHNVFDNRNNMGKTLAGFFAGYGSGYLAELYVHSEAPSMDICQRYYRITDIDVLKSVVFRHRKDVGTVFTATDIAAAPCENGTNGGIKGKLYSFGSKRTSFIYAARNILWQLSPWYTHRLQSWIAEFAPDVIFFAAGDYCFTYDMVHRVSADFHIPVVMYCCDDFFINRRNPDSLLGVLVHRALMRSVRRCVSRAAAVVTICDKMAEAYAGLFDKPIYTVYTGYGFQNRKYVDGMGVVYLGNLGCGRHKSLVDIGRALKNVSAKSGRPLYLHVYSAENRPEILRELTAKNGIVFHGAVDSDTVNHIISESRLVVHAESFDPVDGRKVQYSISTKIANLLASGRCIFAYGPGEVASMEYLRRNQAACVVEDPERLEAELTDILENRERRSAIVEAAKKLSEEKHSAAMVQDQIRSIINSTCANMTGI